MCGAITKLQIKGFENYGFLNLKSAYAGLRNWANLR